jgi:hypothetical protein
VTEDKDKLHVLVKTVINYLDSILDEEGHAVA